MLVERLGALGRFHAIEKEAILSGSRSRNPGEDFLADLRKGLFPSRRAIHRQSRRQGVRKISTPCRYFTRLCNHKHKRQGTAGSPAPAGQQIPLAELATVKESTGASFIYRENNSRYIGIQFSILGRNLEGIVNAGQAAVAKSAKISEGYTLDWGGEYSELAEAKAQFIIIGPLTVLLIFLILFALYGNFKFPVSIALGVVMTEPVGALIALWLTRTPFSVSSILGLLALLGVSVETAVILVSYILAELGGGFKLRQNHSRSHPRRLIAALASHHDDGARGPSRPASRRAFYRRGQRHPETFRHCGRRGTISRLLRGFFVNPVLYEVVARRGALLQV